MSTIKVTNLSGRGGATPNLPDGANITGVATATTFSGTLDGSLKTTGTPTLGLGVTINASGLAISGVATAGIISATTLYGDGSNLTGVGESIAPWHYNPDVNDTSVTISTGIGITFNKKVEAGSGTATLKIVNAGVAGTVHQSWGISSATFNVTEFTLGSLVSNLAINQTYQLDIPSGFVVDSNETSYAGTAYTFAVQAAAGKLWLWGKNQQGVLGQNQAAAQLAASSSPVQVPGNTWEQFAMGGAANTNLQETLVITNSGELFAWGLNYKGSLGQNEGSGNYSSPVQIPGTWKAGSGSYGTVHASKTDGTLWSWGYNYDGNLGLNEARPVNRSSPVQIPGTNWTGTRDTIRVNRRTSYAIKTDGTLWAWGLGNEGRLGVPSIGEADRSSPVQVPGTTWAKVQGGEASCAAIKTDGTLWMWGENAVGQLGQNNIVKYSSPTQIPGTTWRSAKCGNNFVVATKTDNTLWMWGENNYGQLGQNSRDDANRRSSPVQVPGTTWNKADAGTTHTLASKTDGTLWTWGSGSDGAMGVPSIGEAARSSPIQIGSDTEWTGDIQANYYMSYAIQKDETP